MASDIKGILKTMNGMVVEHFILQMEISGKENGRTVKSMGME
jgi:hypothetical protein